MLKKIFFYIAVVGWVASLIIHLLTFAGCDIFENGYIWIMPFLLFAVWIPAMIYLIRSEEYQPLNPFYTLKAIYQRVPFWASITCIICFIYVFILIAISFLTEGGITIEAASAAWLPFYAIAAVILFPTEKQIENDL